MKKTFFKFMMGIAMEFGRNDNIWRFCDMVHLASVIGIVVPTFHGDKEAWAKHLSINSPNTEPEVKQAFDEVWALYEASLS